jgi:hypothetical protein
VSAPSNDNQPSQFFVLNAKTGAVLAGPQEGMPQMIYNDTELVLSSFAGGLVGKACEACVII